MSMICGNVPFEHVSSSRPFQINLQSNPTPSHLLAISHGKKNALLRNLNRGSALRIKQVEKLKTFDLPASPRPG